MSAAPLTAHPARQVSRRWVTVHAVADQPVTIRTHSRVLCPVTRSTGETLCGTLAPLGLADDGGLFPEPVTCPRCLAVAAAENVTIGGDR